MMRLILAGQGPGTGILLPAVGLQLGLSEPHPFLHLPQASWGH